MEYTTLTTDEKLLLARDTLHGRESDHFRISLLSEPNKEFRLAALEVEIEQIREAVSELETEVETEQQEEDTHNG